MQVIELGQVGLAQRAGGQGGMRFFAHTERGGSADSSQVVHALQQAAVTSPEDLQVGQTMSMPALRRICPCEQHEGSDTTVSHADILPVARV